MKPHDKLRLLRTAFNLSQKEVADKIPISPEGYGKIERGETVIDVARAKLFANIFNTDVIVFTTDEEIIVVTLPGSGVKIYLLSAFEKTNTVEQNLESILVEIIAGIEKIKEEVKEISSHIKRNGKLKAWLWFVFVSALSATQLSNELLPVLFE